MDGAVTFRLLQRHDFAMLDGWLQTPHVARWWNHETGPLAVERDFGPTVDGGEPAADFIVQLDGRPVGLLQFCWYADYPDYVEELAPVIAVPHGAVSIDYLIGEADLVGRGLGRAMIEAFCEQVWADHPAAACVLVPVSSANERSWRALLGAGFRLVARGELEPDNPIDSPQHEILRLDRPV